MDLSRYADDLQHRLAVAADAAGGEARELAERLTAPLDAAIRLVLLDALSAAAGEISAELAPGSVDLRLRGGDPEFVVALPTPAEAPALPAAPTAAALPLPPAPPTENADGDANATTRTTLRLPDNLKTHVEVAAARDGISVNSWLVRAVAIALEQAAARPLPHSRPDPRGGTRLTGWVR